MKIGPELSLEKCSGHITCDLDIQNHWKIEVGEHCDFLYTFKGSLWICEEPGGLGARVEAEKAVRKLLQSPRKRWWLSEHIRMEVTRLGQRRGGGDGPVP